MRDINLNKMCDDRGQIFTFYIFAFFIKDLPQPDEGILVGLKTAGKN